MSRLTPPTNGTFSIAVLLIAVGLAARWLLGAGAPASIDFWLVTAGAGVLVVGVLFRRV